MLKFEFILKSSKVRRIAEAVIAVSESDSDKGSSLWYLPIDYWTRRDYVENWLASIEQLQTNGKCAFILIAVEVDAEDTIECYKAWKINNGYVFQHDGLYQDEINEPIDLNQSWKYVESEPSKEIEDIYISQKDIDELKNSLIEYLSGIKNQKNI